MTSQNREKFKKRKESRAWVSSRGQDHVNSVYVCWNVFFFCFSEGRLGIVGLLIRTKDVGDKSQGTEEEVKKIFLPWEFPVKNELESEQIPIRSKSATPSSSSSFFFFTFYLISLILL